MLLLLRLPAAAQMYGPGWDGFAGFSVLRTGEEDAEQFLGWQGSFALNWNSTLGLLADFGGQYKGRDIGISGVSLTSYAYQFLFGPRLNARGEKYTLFGHALFGGSRRGATISSGGSSSSAGSTGLAFGIGGGLDINMGEDFALRIIQMDWIPARFEGAWDYRDARFAIGFVLKSGE
jgi:hypothetical protein